jgi:TolA-binding protein
LKEHKKEKVDIWLYAALLFTSAFVVLLLTAYSQIKLNNSIDEYETKIKGEIKQKYVYQYDLKSALLENKKLKANVEELETKIKELEDKNSSAKLKDEEKKLEGAINFYNILSAAEEEFQKGNLVKSAMLLQTPLDKSILGDTARKKYDLLYSKVNYKASQGLYNEGYMLYMQKNYRLAAGKLLTSYNISSGEYFSDDCLYFAAYSFYNIGKKNDAAVCVNLLLKQFPNSTFKGAVLNLQKKIN